MHASSALALALIGGATAVSAQNTTDKCTPNFQPCLTSAQQFLDFTCTPLRATNATYYQDCRCYHFVNLALCYLLCPDDPNQQAILTGGVKPSITAECNAANLNPSALPQPPPWQTFVATTMAAKPTPTAGTGSGSAVNGAATSPASKNSARAEASDVRSLGVMVAGALSLAAAVWFA
ncbi:hypothetical protein HK105_209341 [Polyrhizophydium stewartii]|uniref:Uncharacterized protein n=1 Tax=Polyrhizophydium stewartii TaxID=2732419 RepID=A0ABR4MVB2_9FUNG|nr:hypothetical protein HK105_002940 [Polyrhizophydium stewartii]